VINVIQTLTVLNVHSVISNLMVLVLLIVEIIGMLLMELAFLALMVARNALLQTLVKNVQLVSSHLAQPVSHLAQLIHLLLEALVNNAQIIVPHALVFPHALFANHNHIFIKVLASHNVQMVSMSQVAHAQHAQLTVKNVILLLFALNVMMVSVS